MVDDKEALRSRALNDEGFVESVLGMAAGATLDEI
jgi:hypothetical protein